MTPATICGIGAVSGAGVGHAALLAGWEREGNNRISSAAAAPPFNQAQDVVCAADFDAQATLGKKGLQFLTRGTHLLLAASQEATANAKVDAELRLGLVIGTNYSALSQIANYDWTVVSEGPSFVSAMDAPNVLANAAASHLAIRVAAHGMNTTISTGRCASLDAIGYAAYFLHEQRVDTVVAGGVEETNAHVLWQFQAAGRDGGPSAAMPGEAAAALVLRRAGEPSDGPVLAQFAAWSNALAPSRPPAELVRDVCREALEVAGLRPADVRLVALGVGDHADLPLAEGVLLALGGADAAPVPTFSLKGLVGETLGAAGALHAVAVVDAFLTETLPASPGVLGNGWPSTFRFAARPERLEPGPALVVEWDPCGFATAIVLVPAAGAAA